MLVHVRTHEEYISFMAPQLNNLSRERPGQVLFYLDCALKVFVLNLDRASEISQGCYSNDFGRPADFNPADMLRTLVLMVALGVTSISAWVQKLKCSDVLAVFVRLHTGQDPFRRRFLRFLEPSLAGR